MKNRSVPLQESAPDILSPPQGPMQICHKASSVLVQLVSMDLLLAAQPKQLRLEIRPYYAVLQVHIRRYQTTWYDPTSVHTNTLIHIDKIREDHAKRCCFALPFRNFNSLTWFRATMFSGISIGSGLSNLWVRSDKGPKQLLRNVHVFFFSIWFWWFQSIPKMFLRCWSCQVGWKSDKSIYIYIIIILYYNHKY